MLSKAVIEDSQDTLWNNMISEFDAENFCIYLETENLNLSPEFKAFEFVWRRDEYNHYIGFQHIYSTLYDKPKEEIINSLSNRTVNFQPIREMLEDEFKICLLLAYDEIATTKSYVSDYDFYASFGHSSFLKWIKLVARDEAYHFNNCMELIGKNYYHRTKEINELVNKFIKWDLDKNEYQGTFVLDHASYSEDFLTSCGNIMKKYF